MKQSINCYWVEFITGFSAAFTFIYYFNKLSKLAFKPEVLSRGELKCKLLVEKLTGKSFVKIRPSFLQNKITGKNLELDCYNAELKLAIEYNGEQHYKHNTFFHKHIHEFHALQYRDALKQTLCNETGVTLIIVPYNVQNMESFLKEKIPVHMLRT